MRSIRSIRWLVPCALAWLAGCDSKVTSRVDADLERRVATFEDCFPHLYPRVEALLDIADALRLTNATPTPDPIGLTATPGVEPGGTIVTIHYSTGGTNLAMTLRFYSPAGAQQTLTTLPGSGSLEAFVDAAATELRDNFPSGDPFVVGDYDISGGGVTATGEALTGILGGSSNQNELAELRTTATSAAVAGGPPATESSTIADSGLPPCSLTFTLPGLRTDESPTQEYPIGTVPLSLTSPDATVGATLTFDGTQVVRAVVDGVPGSFAFDVVTRSLTYQR